MIEEPERAGELEVSGTAPVDESEALRARIQMLEGELTRLRTEVSKLGREHRPERRRERRHERSANPDRVETIKDIVERVDGEGRRFFRAMVLSQMQQMRLTADLVSSFAERIERDNPADDPDVERDLPRDVMDGWLETIDRSLEIPERTIERFEETYKQARRARRSRTERAE